MARLTKPRSVENDLSVENPRANDGGVAWAVYGALGLTAVAIYYVLPRAGVAQAVLLTALNATAAAAAYRRCLRTAGSMRRVWAFLGVAMSLAWVANAFYYGVPLAQGHPLPFPSAIDAFWLSTYPCFVVALYVLTKRYRREQRVGDAVDVLILLVGAGSLMWVFIIGPLVDAALPALAHIVGVAYPTMDLVVFAVFIRLVVGVSHPSGALRLLLASFVALLAADVLYAVQLSRESYSLGGPTDALWMASYLLIGVAALHPSAGRRPRAPEPVAHRMGRARAGLLWASVLTGPVLLATRPKDIVFVASASAASVVLVMLRMTRLNRQLADVGVALEEKVAERTAELDATRAFLERLLTAGPVLVRRVTVPERRISYVSPNIERLFGITQEEALAPGFLGSLVHPDDRALFDAALDRVADGSAAREEIEYRLVHRDGLPRWFSAVLVPERDDQGRISAVLGYILDVDDRRRAEQAMREAQQAAETANRAKSEFLSRMSHELRTPLNAVLGFGQLLEMDSLSEDQHESVDQILKGGRHLLDLINEVLDISGIEAGDLALSPEAVSVDDLVGEAVDLIRPLAAQRDLQVVFDRSPACDRYVFADRQRSKQVLLNLLSNAVKYNRPRGTVAVSCDAVNDTRIRIAVADTGAGIPEEAMGRLFTPFDRLGAEHSGEEGTGIGLALSQRLVEAMGGDLRVQSALGHGSTFILELPRAEGPLERYERLDGGEQGGGRRDPLPRRRVVLHIEDNLANLKLVERVLAQRTDLEVVAAMQGRLGLELAREHRPVLVLLDLHLPDMSGEQVLHRLRDDPATESIPVAIVSADATTGQAQRLLTAGAAAYLTKPIDVHGLRRLLDDTLFEPSPEKDRT